VLPKTHPQPTGPGTFHRRSQQGVAGRSSIWTVARHAACTLGVSAEPGTSVRSGVITTNRCKSVFPGTLMGSG
jgi:hypothetical protein